MTSKLWRMYAEREFYKWEKTVLWDMIEPYRRSRSFTPLISIYVAAFYTGVVGSAMLEQLYKEKYWEEHPGEAVPLMPPKFYWGPWRVMRTGKSPDSMLEMLETPEMMLCPSIQRLVQSLYVSLLLRKLRCKMRRDEAFVSILLSLGIGFELIRRMCCSCLVLLMNDSELIHSRELAFKAYCGKIVLRKFLLNYMNCFFFLPSFGENIFY